MRSIAPSNGRKALAARLARLEARRALALVAVQARDSAGKWHRLGASFHEGPQPILDRKPFANASAPLYLDSIASGERIAFNVWLHDAPFFDDFEELHFDVMPVIGDPVSESIGREGGVLGTEIRMDRACVSVQRLD